MEDLARRLDIALAYYCWRARTPRSATRHRPSVCASPPSALALAAVPPPRGRPGERVAVTIPFALRTLGDDVGHRLPYLVINVA
jgi:hypothetical protein